MWTASHTFEIGDLYVGVRSYPAALSNRVRTTLANLAVEGVDAPPNYSLRLETRERGRNGRDHRTYALYRSQCLLLRTRKRRRALDALVHCLRGHIEPRDGLIRVRQLAVVGRSGAVILPPELYRRLEAMEARLEGHGMFLADPPFADVDIGTGELVLAPPVIDAGGGSHHEESSLGARHASRAYGRYPIREWTFLRRDHDNQLPTPEAVGALMLMLDAEARVPDVIEAMARAVSRIRLTSIWHERPSRLLELLVEGTR